MLEDRNKISLRQVFLLYLSLEFTSSIRYVPSYTAVRAKQAAWLSPIASFFVIIPFYLMLDKLYKKYKDASMMNIIYDVTGLAAGKIIGILYVLWFVIIQSVFTRYYAERLVSSIFPSIDIAFFIVVMLAAVAFMLHSGIVVIARMNEIIFAITAIVFCFLVVFLLPKFDVKKLTPISYLDIIPVLKASLGVTSIWSYMFYVFFFSDQINDKENIKKMGFKTTIFITIANVLMIASAVGTYGYSVVERLPIPFLATVKQISIFNTLERIESVLVVLWITSDFILEAVFTYAHLSIIKSLFDLSDTKPLINIYLAFIFLFSLFMNRSRSELEMFSESIATYANIFYGLIIPLVIFIVAKARKKV